MIKILTAKQYRINELMQGSQFRAPVPRDAAEQQASQESCFWSHVAVIDGTTPLWALIDADSKRMTLSQSVGDDAWEDVIEINSTKEGIDQLLAIAVEVLKESRAAL